MSGGAEAALHRIEVLPGDGRFAVTFRHATGAEQTATARLDRTGSGELDVAEASLPVGWRRGDAAFRMLVAAVRALDDAAQFAPAQLQLVDVDGGWDVSLGNVVLAADDQPRCIAHGAMTRDAALWTCAECGARAAMRT